MFGRVWPGVGEPLAGKAPGGPVGVGLGERLAGATVGVGDPPVGGRVGDAVGSWVGVEVGASVGVELGATVGVELGASVGVAAFAVALVSVGTLATSLPAGSLVARVGERQALIAAAIVDGHAEAVRER